MGHLSINIKSLVLAVFEGTSEQSQFYQLSLYARIGYPSIVYVYMYIYTEYAMG